MGDVQLPAPASNEDAGRRSHWQPRSAGEIRTYCRRVWLVLSGSGHIRIHYPKRFKVLCALGFVCSVVMVLNFFLDMARATSEASRPYCRFHNAQLQQNANMLFLYFLSVIFVRSFAFLPGVAAQIALVRPQTHGTCWVYAIHLVVHGPLYIFSMGSLLFWVQLLQAPSCQAQNPSLYKSFTLHAGFSSAASSVFLIIVFWHTRLLAVGIRAQQEDRRRAPPDTIEKLHACVYDEAIFGDEEGKRFPSECPICLSTWESQDIIKITPCLHAFHEDCLRGWLNSERTCALCRRDVTEPGLRLVDVTSAEGEPERHANAQAAAADTIGARSDPGLSPPGVL
mmetsp:Transcript_1571/g.3537  ORF Transcript_1571/g.3537 Transcript_1571/m.3537 type:complete len:339 (+) Transcript_1571:45-1061(+)